MDTLDMKYQLQIDGWLVASSLGWLCLNIIVRLLFDFVYHAYPATTLTRVGRKEAWRNLFVSSAIHSREKYEAFSGMGIP